MYGKGGWNVLGYWDWHMYMTMCKTWASQVQRGRESTCQYRRYGFDPWIRKMWRRKWRLSAVFLPGKFHGKRSLGGYSLWGHKESDTTEWLTLLLFTFMMVELSPAVLTSWQMQWWLGCLMWNCICSEPCTAADTECSLTPDQGHQHQGLFRLTSKGHWVDVTEVLLIFHR